MLFYKCLLFLWNNWLIFPWHICTIWIQEPSSVYKLSSGLCRQEQQERQKSISKSHYIRFYIVYFFSIIVLWNLKILTYCQTLGNKLLCFFKDSTFHVFWLIQTGDTGYDQRLFALLIELKGDMWKDSQLVRISVLLNFSFVPLMLFNYIPLDQKW